MAGGGGAASFGTNADRARPGAPAARFPYPWGRAAPHQGFFSINEAGEPLPVDFRDRAIYYVGPVGAAPGEVVGPAGPTTSTRMDGFADAVLSATGLLVMIGKAERGPAAIEEGIGAGQSDARQARGIGRGSNGVRLPE